MAKCKDCGFLAVWIRLQNRFDEASEQVREQGRPEGVINNEESFQAKCFIRKHDLVAEIETNKKSVLAGAFGYGARVLEVIDTERACAGYTTWMQGFHPKEHEQMLLNHEMLERQRRHSTFSLIVGILAIIGTLIVAFMSNMSAHIAAEATIKAAQMQIEAHREISKQAQPIN